MPEFNTGSDLIRTGQAVQAVDAGVAIQASRGSAIASGCVPDKESELTVEATAGSVYVDGELHEVEYQTADIDPGSVQHRKDIVYYDETGILHVEKGTPAAAEGPDNTTFSGNPFAFWEPSPPDMTEVPGTPVAEVAIPQGATDFNSITHLRGRRVFSDQIAWRLSADRELLVPQFDDLDDAPNIERNLVIITGQGSDPGGLYHYDGVQWEQSAGGGSISEVDINNDKDWGGFNITGVGDFEAESVTADRFASTGGGGFLSRMGHHTNYGQTTGFEEIARVNLLADEYLEVYRLETVFKGGGTNPDFTVRVRDDTGGSVLASTSSQLVAGATPVGTSSLGATILLEYENQTDAPQDVCISGIDVVSIESA